MRSKWKGLLIRKYKDSFNYDFRFIIRKRSLGISEDILSKKVEVYNGRKLFGFTVKKDMIGFKFGDFAITKIRGSKIHEDKKKKNRNVKKRK